MNAVSLKAKKSGVGMPASRMSCLAMTLSAQRMQADTPEPVYGMPTRLEQLLDGPVLAVAAVERDERDVRRGLAEARDSSWPTSIPMTS